MIIINNNKGDCFSNPCYCQALDCMLVIYELLVYTITLWDFILSPFFKSLDKSGNSVKHTFVQGWTEIGFELGPV